MDKNAGKKWPWIITLSVVAIIGASVLTVKVALKGSDEPSDYGMQNYHEYDKNANEIIEAKIAFDRLYTIAYEGEGLNQKGSVLRYRITDKEGNGVDNARINVVLTRPDTSKLNIALDNPAVNDGTYTFKTVELPKAGRWDVMAKINVDGKQRFYNFKADTRNDQRIEF